MIIKGRYEGDEDRIETKHNDTFDIYISRESDCSLDGGYTFEMTTNSASLSKEDCELLIKDLELFLLEIK